MDRTTVDTARILVADDDPDLRALLCGILTDEGHKVAAVSDGRRALEAVLSDPPDLMMLDVMMPHMDGFAVLKGMAEAGVGNVKVLMVTARSAETDWAEGFRLGADLYVTKPFDPAELSDAVTRVLASTKAELADQREHELDKAEMLSHFETLFEVR
ncbi:MAG: response regulator transcription factor [Actinomycetota bacterium]|nr:response regulator transcription factor [Actinomycetota bacterium]